ncbi:aldehyde dehydrogenase [Sphingobium sp. SCG-1]|uniref:aldehyde dehydrogenase family protein n=1 Tax=Sphingobium sp. SCG-1 TaxID=2072936 RepID=UPI000CD6A9C0|nr:aldehyde dehydrogenase family protein [Sphingobium sp. SCG-1]AUW59661.1 aldehyde dehydrogenase [Sphingobium sp. SCG-1]
MSTARTFKLLIDGASVDGESLFDVINPATEEVVGRAPDATRQQLDQAVASARRAYPKWKETPIAERQAMVAALGRVINENIEELKRLLTAEQGKPLGDAEQDIGGGAYFCAQSAELTPPVEVHEDSDVRRSATYRVPLGVVCAIAPWNFPIAIAFWKVAPALVAGNTVVLKPSPFTPLTTLRIAELARDILPSGVFNVLSGSDRLGPWMTGHPGFDKISFTGSTATGRRVMESAAPTLKRLTLELGGNDAAIVLPGVDVQSAASQLFQAAFANSGQVCFAPKRVYVHSAVYEDFAASLAELAKQAKVGDGAEQGTSFGPIQNRPQYERVQDLIADCRTNGYGFLAGQDNVPDKGYFVPLTIIDNPPADARIVREEQFGPVLPLIRFDDIEAALEQANDCDYGLGGSVWGPPELAEEIALRMDTGMVWVNEFGSMAPSQPFGGRKQSGFGVENGMAGLLEYTSIHTIVTAKQANVA